MAIDKEIKKKVIEDWQKAFPELTFYAQDKLYKIVGSLIIGLELIKLPRTEEYRPHFVIYFLGGNRLGKDAKACLSSPILLMEYYDNRGFQYDIPYEKHNVFFNDVLESVKKQTPISLKEDISLRNLISVIDDYANTSSLSAAPNSYLQATLQASKFGIALSVNILEAKNVFEQIKERSWDIKSFDMWEVNIYTWLHELQEKINNRDEFLKQIEINKTDKKIAKLKRSELIA